MNENDFGIEFSLEQYIDKIKTDELLDRLGSDYDENGIPYWEK